MNENKEKIFIQSILIPEQVYIQTRFISLSIPKSFLLESLVSVGEEFLNDVNFRRQNEASYALYNIFVHCTWVFMCRDII